MEELRQLVRRLVDVLHERARAGRIDKVKFSAALNAARGKARVEAEPTNRLPYDWLFGFGSNGPKYWWKSGATKDSSKSISVEHVARIKAALIQLGVDMANINVGENKTEWAAFLSAAIERVKVVGSVAKPTQAIAEELISHPAWRIVPRGDIALVIQEKLLALGVAAIVGMSGVGKSVLAGQVVDLIRHVDGGRSPWPIVEISARTELKILSDRELPGERHYLEFWAKLLPLVAKALLDDTQRPAPSLNQKVWQFREDWATTYDRRNSHERRFLQKIGSIRRRIFHGVNS